MDTVLAVTFYQLSVFVHVLAAVVAFGPTFAFGIIQATAFFLDGVAQDPAFNQPDGIHPNSKGVDVVVERLLPFITKNLDTYATSVRSAPRP